MDKLLCRGNFGFYNVNLNSNQIFRPQTEGLLWLVDHKFMFKKEVREIRDFSYGQSDGTRKVDVWRLWWLLRCCSIK